MKPPWLTPTIETWTQINLQGLRARSGDALEAWKADEWGLLKEEAKRLSQQWESFWRYLDAREHESDLKKD